MTTRQTEIEEAVHIPKWAVTVIFMVLANILIVVFSAGALSNRVTELERRVGGLELRLFGPLK